MLDVQNSRIQPNSQSMNQGYLPQVLFKPGHAKQQLQTIQQSTDAMNAKKRYVQQYEAPNQDIKDQLEYEKVSELIQKYQTNPSQPVQHVRFNGWVGGQDAQNQNPIPRQMKMNEQKQASGGVRKYMSPDSFSGQRQSSQGIGKARQQVVSKRSPTHQVKASGMGKNEQRVPDHNTLQNMIGAKGAPQVQTQIRIEDYSYIDAVDNLQDEGSPESEDEQLK